MDRCDKCGVDLTSEQGITLIACSHVFCDGCAKLSVAGKDGSSRIYCVVESCGMEWMDSQVNAVKSYLDNIQLEEHSSGDDNDTNCNQSDSTFAWEEEVAETSLHILCDVSKCALCCDSLGSKCGIMLDACLHVFCRSCLQQSFHVQTTAEIKCPLSLLEECSEIVTERELKAILSPNDFQNFLQRSLRQAQESMINYYKCATQNCDGWCNYEDNTRTFNCYLCSKINCIGCNAIHEDLTCNQYQEVLQEFMSTGRNINEVMEGMRKSGWAQVNYLIAKNGHSVEDYDLILTVREIECAICMTDVEPGEAIILHDCFHIFCSECLRNLVNYSDEPDIKCPYIDGNFSCNSLLEPREIRALLSEEEHDKYITKQLKYAEGATPNSFHCLTVDCPGFCEIVDGNVNEFRCEVCGKVSCILCKIIHVGVSCEDYRNRQVQDENKNLNEAAMTQMLNAGTAMRCPKCKTIIEKNLGCDAIVCSGCRSELCWATKGMRWGPGGRGDSSGGCRCKVNGQLCVPNCQNCH